MRATSAKKQKSVHTGEHLGLRERAAAALADINILFEIPGEHGMVLIDIEHRPFVQLLRDALRSVVVDLSEGREAIFPSLFFTNDITGKPDSVDYINRLADYCRRQSFTAGLEAAIMDLISMQRDFFDIIVRPEHPEYRRLTYMLEHAANLGRMLYSFFGPYVDCLKCAAGEQKGLLSRVNPDVVALGGQIRVLPEYISGVLSERELWQLHELSKEADPFRLSCVFRYINENFVPLELELDRPVDKFYGYATVKSTFHKHFTAFLHGENNIPILISSLPGMGKTSFTIAHTLQHEKLTLILPDPEALGAGLPHLLHRLEQRRNRKFVVFFDDIEPSKVDWYYFRTNIGGSLGAPSNVMLAIATNYNYPPNVASRGREVTFPPFDVVTSSGMVYDYLQGLKMQSPAADLVASILADYLEEFGQKVYAELSPRSLVRYLESFDHDMRRRKRLLDMSRGAVVARPDPQMFYDFNVKLIRLFYGEAGLEELRERILGQRD